MAKASESKPLSLKKRKKKTKVHIFGLLVMFNIQYLIFNIPLSGEIMTESEGKKDRLEKSRFHTIIFC